MEERAWKKDENFGLGEGMPLVLTSLQSHDFDETARRGNELFLVFFFQAC